MIPSGYSFLVQYAPKPESTYYGPCIRIQWITVWVVRTSLRNLFVLVEVYTRYIMGFLLPGPCVWG